MKISQKFLGRIHFSDDYRHEKSKVIFLSDTLLEIIEKHISNLPESSIIHLQENVASHVAKNIEHQEKIDPLPYVSIEEITRQIKIKDPYFRMNPMKSVLKMYITTYGIFSIDMIPYEKNLILRNGFKSEDIKYIV